MPNNRGGEGISVLVLNSTGSPGRFLLSNLLSKNKRLLGEFSPKINNLGRLEYVSYMQKYNFYSNLYMNSLVLQNLVSF